MSTPERNTLQMLFGLSELPASLLLSFGATSQGSPGFYSIRDPHQMVWVLKENSLIAVPSSSNVKPVIISSLPCKDTNVHVEGEGSLIYLGVMGRDLCLFCTELEGQPTLQLKEKKIMDLYRENEAQVPFLFLRSIEGSTSTFQSVAYPSWFIATSSEAGQPIILTKERGKTYNTNFFFTSEMGSQQTLPESRVADSGTEDPAARELPRSL